MDADFEKHYQAAERAYGLGEYAEAHALTSALWDQLQSASPEQAAIAYERVLQGDVDATIAALAEQGVKRCRSEDITSGAGTTPATNGAIPDLLKDPFLSTNPDQARPAPADVVTAMPWLSSDADLEINPTTEESSEDNVETITLSPSPEPTVTPEASSNVEVEVETVSYTHLTLPTILLV